MVQNITLGYGQCRYNMTECYKHNIFAKKKKKGAVHYKLH